MLGTRRALWLVAVIVPPHHSFRTLEDPPESKKWVASASACGPEVSGACAVRPSKEENELGTLLAADSALVTCNQSAAAPV